MYFNNDIKINKFINKSDFHIYLNVMFRTDSSQRWTNELTPEMNAILWEIQKIQVSFGLN